MKIIDLLNKIANGEEVPEKIKYRGVIWLFEDNTYLRKDLTPNFDDSYRKYLLGFYNFNILNDEVEIIEEENKFTKEDFIKETMDLEGLTREEFNKIYEVKECNCGRKFCKGFIKVEKVEEEKKIPEKLLGEPRHIYNENELYIVGKVNEIIDYLKSKEEYV